MVQGEHTLYLIVEATDEDRVRTFMEPFGMAGTVDVYPATTCARVVASGGCATPMPVVDETVPAMDPEDACQRAIEAGLVLHRAHPLNCETSIPALIGGAVMPNAHFYVLVWGVGQLATGALSDHVGRKRLIAGGLAVQAATLAVIAIGDGFAIWAIGAIGLGIGTAMAYPTLLAAVGDVARPAWRASAVGVYRLWRDAGFVVGALLSGTVADLFGLVAAIWVVAVVTLVGAGIVLVRMYETHPHTSAPADRAASFGSTNA